MKDYEFWLHQAETVLEAIKKCPACENCKDLATQYFDMKNDLHKAVQTGEAKYEEYKSK